MRSLVCVRVLGFVVAVGAAVFASCGCAAASRAEAATARPRLPVATPERRDAVLEREYVAEIRAVRHAELRARVPGVIDGASVDDGQRVTAGQKLFSINARALRAEVGVARAVLLGAEAELRAAELELENTTMLEAKKVVSHAEVALAESKVQTLRAKLEEAKAQVERAVVELGYAEVAAPFDGVVNRVPRRAGSAVAEGELLTTVTDTSEVFAYFRIGEREYLELVASAAAEEHKVSLRLADGTLYEEEGTIDAVASEFDRETGTLAYRARFRNDDGLLKHGSSGKVVVQSALGDALVVPQRATYDVQGDLHVYVLDEANVARARKIAVKARVGDSFVVEEGLASTERFIIEGVQKVRDGLPIDVVDAIASKDG